MLTFERVYDDGRHVFSVIPVGENGNLVKLEDKLQDECLKQYFSKDDETSIAIFEAMLDYYNRVGYELLSEFKIKDRIPEELFNRIDEMRE